MGKTTWQSWAAEGLKLPVMLPISVILSPEPEVVATGAPRGGQSLGANAWATVARY